MTEHTDATQTTPEGTEFTVSGERVIFPTPEFEYGGGIALTDEAVTEILAYPGSGEREGEQLEWEWTGETEATRAGDSKVVELRQTSFGRTRTTQVTLVDIGDANVEAVV